VHPYPALPHHPIPDRREEKEGGKKRGRGRSSRGKGRRRPRGRRREDVEG
jgi:hypothetical protein